jgi:DOPA 4,5-dioxygenase
MSERGIQAITGYHAHVYYDADSKPRAARVREAVEQHFEVAMGRWRDQPVGPHPTGSYQIAFAPGLFAQIVPWLALNRDGLTVFLHPITGDDVPDHRDYAIWMGEQQAIDLSALE